MNGVRVGLWSLSPYREPQFRYDEAWFHHPSFRSISLSLPASAANPVISGMHVNHYFDNLLPDSESIRHRLQSKFHTKDISAFSLLTAIGRDCVGAIQFLPLDEEPSHLGVIEATPLTDLEVEHTILQTLASPSGLVDDSQDDLRLSIAGAQEKTALLFHEGNWCLPLGATPTTHIFKLPLGLIGNRKADMTTSVENEWLCSRILHAFGVPVAETRMSTFGQTKVLIVTRFDRMLAQAGTHYLRLPQEDFCQVTGTPFSHKYENEGGPGMLKIAEILRNSVQSNADMVNFFKAQMLFWMLRATDGHAKNFSIFLLPQNRFRLTPMYDVLSAWPIIGAGPSLVAPQKVKMAMAWQGKNKHYLAAALQYRHFVKTMQKGGLATDPSDLMDELIARTPAVIATVSAELPGGFPEKLANKIFAGLQASADSLELLKKDRA
ncbi:MAG: type II toxin-antitoxin system HipA family toxin [Agitococcus sp.]|nr:type II toxin-antitoxin system HipA family toxin [Agitococcus sp.]